MTTPVLQFPGGPIGLVLSRLQKVTKNATGWLARCPSHDDGRPSLSVSTGTDGRVLMTCFAGCAFTAIVAALNLQEQDLFPPRTDRPLSSGPQIVKTYDYQDDAGNVRFQVVRMQPKDFRQRHKDPSGEWIWNMKGVDRLLYNLPGILEAKAAGRTVLVVEGERDADNLIALKFAATTNPGGAKKWLPAYTETLRGAKVVIIPDSDKVGHEHRDLVAGQLLGVAAELRVVDVPAPHKDISDWLKDGGDAAALKAIVQQTPLHVPAVAPTAPIQLIPDDGAPPPIAPPPPPSKEEKPRKFARSDLGNAERMFARHGEDLRFVKKWKSWLVWDGQRWRRDETYEATRRATETVRSMLDDIRSTLLRSDEREELFKFMTKSESAGRVRGMMELAQTLDGIPIETEQMDGDPFLLNVANGTLDLRTGKLREHNRADLITKIAGVRFNERAEAPTFLAFLHRIMDGNADLILFLKQAIGYALTGVTTEQCFFFCYGNGANGKTTLLEILRALLGDYATQADFNTFLERKGEGPRNDIARLFGARLVTSSEAGEGKRLDETLLKSLTGSETVSARFLYADLFEFKPTFKLFLAANHKPVIRGTDKGIWRRPRLIPFTVEIPTAEQDKDLLAKLTAELPGILNWAIEGCQLWLEEGTLRVPDEVRAANDEYRVESDILGAFIADCCELGSGLDEPSSNLYEAYKSWTERGGEFRLTQTKFGTAMRDRGIPVEKRHGGIKWRVGIRLLERPNLSNPRPSDDGEQRFF